MVFRGKKTFWVEWDIKRGILGDAKGHLGTLRDILGHLEGQGQNSVKRDRDIFGLPGHFCGNLGTFGPCGTF